MVNEKMGRCVDEWRNELKNFFSYTHLPIYTFTLTKRIKMKFRITPIDGGVCVVDGIYASGVNAGFKKDGFDLGFIRIFFIKIQFFNAIFYFFFINSNSNNSG